MLPRFGFNNCIRNIFPMRIFFFQPPLVLQLLGCGRALSSVNLCLPQVHASKVSISSEFPIWTTTWVPTLPSFIPQPKFPNNRELLVGLISDFIRSGRTQWNLGALQSVFDAASVYEISKIRISFLGFDSCTTPIQQLYNNPSHEDEPQYVGPTLM
jgi:hypothetical protein